MFKDRGIKFGLKRFVLVKVCVFLSLGSGYAQISGGDIEEGKEKKPEKEKKERTTSSDSLAGITYYLTGMYQYTDRYFEDRSVYNYYAERSNETASYGWGTGLGIIMELDKGFSLDIGLSFFGHGEEYLFEADTTDSLFQYRRSYTQVGLPLKLRYTYGDKFQVFGFIGAMPLNILNMRYDEYYKRNDGVEVDAELTGTKSGFSQFGFMVSGGIGINYQLNHIGFTLYPEYRRYLTNTFADVSIPLVHRMFGFGIHTGILIKI